jgi:hypothetical protein
VVQEALSFALSVALAAVGGATQKYDWSTDDFDNYGFENADIAKQIEKFSESRAICAKVIFSEPPKSDYPSPEEAARLKDCSSEQLYYGIGRAVDAVAARKCALIEREKGLPEFSAPAADYYYGTGMLVTIYANGKGAKQNLDVAMHLACGMEDAPAAMEGRIRNLNDRKQSQPSEDFGICDDATSGISGAFCMDHVAQLAEDKRTKKIASLSKEWSKEQKASFQRLYASMEKYANTANDMNCFRGTGAAACSIQGAEEDMTRFFNRIEAVIEGRKTHKDRLSDVYNPATAPSIWKEAYEYELASDEREWYLENAKGTVKARAVFERDLVAFATLVLPSRSSHEIRGVFSDI